MNDDLYLEQLKLEREMRDRSISKFLKDHEDDLENTITGSYLMSAYILPLSRAIQEFLDTQGLKTGRKNIAYKGLSLLPAEVSAFLFVKGLLNRLPLYSRENTRLSVTSLSIYTAGLLHDELRIRTFEADNKALVGRILTDFDKRELPRYKRKEYLQAVIHDANEEWALWTKVDMVNVGVKLLDLFIQTTGDVRIVRSKVDNKKYAIDLVTPSDGLLRAVERIAAVKEDLTSTWFPMVYPPVPWSTENLQRGGYLSHHITPYKLVKGSRKPYNEMLKDKAEVGGLDITLDAINAIQETPWRINSRVVAALEHVYENNIECGKLPRADNKVPDPPPENLEYLPKEDPRVTEYRRYRAVVHEFNRRSVGKRVLAIRAIHTAKRFSDYGRLYFPHDLDSRGRAYPKPNPLNPQGPDYVKGLLEFADGKALGRSGLYWLGVHGANTFGEDKSAIAQRAAWAETHIEQIRSVASDPTGDLWWTRAENPVQFLAFCFEYAKAQAAPETFVSHLHVDLDATCSGLQHFSAMLRDEVGGYHVNMTPSAERQDVYGAVANEANKLFERDVLEKHDKSQMARAWLTSGLMDRKVAKRPVMVKPYSGTLSSCLAYVRDAVEEKLDAGAPLPWAKDDMFNFKLYGGMILWEAIPKVVIAADEAMLWISKVARAVGKSQPEDMRIEWETPVGFPVWLRKVNMKSVQIRTTLDGSRYEPRLVEETDKLDPRQMASATAPSFVHSLDGAHLQLTVASATDEEFRHFAMVHDSFGVHAADVSRFSEIIREAFVELYSYDVLKDFIAGAKPLISDPELLEGLPPTPEKGTLKLEDVLKSEFFFS